MADEPKPKTLTVGEQLVIAKAALERIVVVTTGAMGPVAQEARLIAEQTLTELSLPPVP